MGKARVRSDEGRTRALLVFGLVVEVRVVAFERGVAPAEGASRGRSSRAYIESVIPSRAAITRPS